MSCTLKVDFYELMLEDIMAIDAPLHTSESNLARVLGTGLPVLLVFWQRACAPCDLLAPTLDRLARLYAGRALVVKVNAADEPGLSGRYKVDSLPGIVFFKDGRAIATTAGAASEQSLTEWVDYLIAGGPQPVLPSGPSIPFQAAAPSPSGQARQGSARGAAQNAGTEKPIVLTDASFDQVIRSSSLPVMVDFWATWCGPCKMIAPVVEQMAGEFAGRALLGKLDVDQNPAVAGRYGVMSIPTLLIFRHGQVVDRIVGAQPPQVIRQRLTQQLQ
jgi:thioredoxin 1